MRPAESHGNYPSQLSWFEFNWTGFGGAIFGGRGESTHLEAGNNLFCIYYSFYDFLLFLQLHCVFPLPPPLARLSFFLNWNIFFLLLLLLLLLLFRVCFCMSLWVSAYEGRIGWGRRRRGVAIFHDAFRSQVSDFNSLWIAPIGRFSSTVTPPPPSPPYILPTPTLFPSLFPCFFPSFLAPCSHPRRHFYDIHPKFETHSICFISEPIFLPLNGFKSQFGFSISVQFNLVCLFVCVCGNLWTLFCPNFLPWPPDFSQFNVNRFVPISGLGV